jgi:hypothetical protein
MSVYASEWQPSTFYGAANNPVWRMLAGQWDAWILLALHYYPSFMDA